MKIVDSIISMIAGSKNLSMADVPEGICPNCWGRNEYGGAFYEAIKNDNININDLDARVGWVQDYAVKYLSDIALSAHSEDNVCNICKVKYKKVG